MKLVDEKKALMEMSSLKKTRKTVESFAAQQSSIDNDKKRVDEIRTGLDDPDAKAISDKFNAARAELDAINKQHDEANKGRDGLFEERNAVSKELDAVFSKKKDSANAFREANNKFCPSPSLPRAISIITFAHTRSSLRRPKDDGRPREATGASTSGAAVVRGLEASRSQRATARGGSGARLRARD